MKNNILVSVVCSFYELDNMMEFKENIFIFLLQNNYK